MKRYTMTPISRKMQKLPINSKTPNKNPRYSIAPEDNKKRDIRTVRDPNYKKECIDNVYKFLVENNFDGNISQKTLMNPSNKEFQSIFKFIFSFIDDYEYSNKFEEDVVNILKLLKYPFSSEITKSQLMAITPHIWPIILSMLSWMIDLMLNIEEQIEIDKPGNDLENYFNEFVSVGYVKYMNGEEDNFEEELERKVQNLYVDMFKGIDERKKYLEELEVEVENIKNGCSGLGDLEQKKMDFLEDLNSLIASQKQLENKKTKYSNNIKKALEEIEALESEVNELRRQQDELNEKISKQKINPKDVKIMNKEKLDLYKELEKITPEKERYMIKNKELEKDLADVIEENERLIYDLNTIKEDLDFKIIKENDTIYFNREISDIMNSLDDEYNRQLQKVEELKINKENIINLKDDKETILREIESKIEFSQNKLMKTGEIYLQKKAKSEEEQKKNKSQMENLENELLQLNLESNSSLIQSEQGLHKIKISYDKTKDKCRQEKEIIESILCNFNSNMENYKESLKKLNDKLNGLKSLNN